MLDDHTNLILAIGRLRRAMPRNMDVLLVCEELEKRLTQPKTGGPSKFDKVAYQREYMRRYRAAKVVHDMSVRAKA